MLHKFRLNSASSNSKTSKKERNWSLCWHWFARQRRVAWQTARNTLGDTPADGGSHGSRRRKGEGAIRLPGPMDARKGLFEFFEEMVDPRRSQPGSTLLSCDFGSRRSLPGGTLLLFGLWGEPGGMLTTNRETRVTALACVLFYRHA